MFYHVTPAKKLKAIARQGLRRGKQSTSEYLSHENNDASSAQEYFLNEELEEAKPSKYIHYSRKGIYLWPTIEQAREVYKGYMVSGEMEGEDWAIIGVDEDSIPSGKA